MKSLMVSSIQRYSIHDGPGIRTTVFFAGCPLSCPWCHNPECIPFEATILINTEKCNECGTCAQVCPVGATRLDGRRLAYDRTLCNACGDCVENCPTTARVLSAKPYDVDTLARLMERDQPFFKESGGGVTLSGGEVMAQNAQAIDNLLRLLREHDIDVNIDTCGFAPKERFTAVLPWVHTFMYDLKAFDSALHKRLTGQDNERILDNLKTLSDAGARLDLRIPVIGDANDNLADWEAAADWLQRNVHLAEIHLLPYHNTGSSKYTRMGLEAQAFSAPDPGILRSMQELFQTRGFSTPFIGG